MNIKTEEIRKAWDIYKINKVNIRISMNNLCLKGQWLFTSKTKLAQNANAIARYCMHVPQKLLESSEDAVVIRVSVNAIGLAIDVDERIWNILDTETIINDLFEKVCFTLRDKIAPGSASPGKVGTEKVAAEENAGPGEAEIAVTEKATLEQIAISNFLDDL